MSQENMSLEEEAISNAYQYAYTLSNGKEGKLDRSNCIKVAQAEREGRTEVELELKGNFNHRTKVLVDLVVNTMKYPGGISTNFYSVSPPHLPAQHPSSCATLFRPILQGRVIPSTHCTIHMFFTYIGKNKSSTGWFCAHVLSVHSQPVSAVFSGRIRVDGVQSCSPCLPSN